VLLLFGLKNSGIKYLEVNASHMAINLELNGLKRAKPRRPALSGKSYLGFCNACGNMYFAITRHKECCGPGCAGVYTFIKKERRVFYRALNEDRLPIRDWCVDMTPSEVKTMFENESWWIEKEFN
jgi:hypothetical protein